MVDGQHRVGLTATERRLKLDHGVTAAPGQPFDHGIEQQPHAFRYEGALKEERRVLVLGGCGTIMHTRQIGGKLGLLKRTLEYVFVRNCDFSPGFQHLHTSQVTVQSTSLIRPISSTLGCASMGLISCFSRCATLAGSIERGSNFECLAGCSRCNTT